MDSQKMTTIGDAFSILVLVDKDAAIQHTHTHTHSLGCVSCLFGDKTWRICRIFSIREYVMRVPAAATSLGLEKISWQQATMINVLSCVMGSPTMNIGYFDT